MPMDYLGGLGDVFVKKTGDPVCRAHYRIAVSHPGRDGEDIHGAIDFDQVTAHRLLREAALLTLRLDDGRFLDFFVTGISAIGGVVDVTVNGSFRSDL